MATLHVLSQSPFADDRLHSCLRLLGDNDGLLLSGDAVYALLPGSALRQSLEQLDPAIRLFALDEDLLARGLADLPDNATALDYPAFVEACCHFERVNSWL